ncbi:MAG: hypothetical protein PUJ51_24855 [Clostridiales bacterium]|nr:hypothetical protein [Clostridiales bacterium]
MNTEDKKLLDYEGLKEYHNNLKENVLFKPSNVIISDHTDDANGKCIIINSTGSTLPESKPYTIVFGEKGFIINDDKPGNTYNNIITINNDELNYKNILIANNDTIKYKNKEIPTDPIDINFDQTCENTNAQENALIMKGE